jgi:hypothetical protein
MAYVLEICRSILRYYEISVIHKRRLTHHNFILCSYKTNGSMVNCFFNTVHSAVYVTYKGFLIIGQTQPIIYYVLFS